MPPATRKTSAAKAAAEDARANALAAFITKANKGKPGEMFQFNGAALAVPHIPTGALSLDLALGVGGLPRGRVIEIYGPESAGKTSLSLSVAAEAIKAGGMAALIDAEHAITPSHLAGMGVDQDFFAITQPESGEDAFRKLEEMLDADLFDVIIVDSVAALTPEDELNGEVGDKFVGSQARMMSQNLRRVTSKIGKSKAVVIFINQIRMKIGGYGNPEDTPGGKALKFFASVRLEVRAPAGDRIKHPTKTGEFIGLGTRVRVVKNKVAPPQKVAEYQLIWGQGINFAGSVFDVAKELGVIEGDSAHRYTLVATGEQFTEPGSEPPVILRGAQKIRDLFTSDRELAEKVAALCKDAMTSSLVEVDANAGPIPDSEFDEDAEHDAA